MKKIVCFLICIAIILIAFLAVGQSLRLTESQIAFLQKLVDENYLKLKPELNKAYVDPSLWNSMDINLKEDFAASLPIYCGNVKKTNIYWVDIYDLYSGKRIAKYSQTWGLKVY